MTSPTRPTERPLVILFSGHHAESDRRAGFHHLATAYHEMGWRVVFVTVGLSYVSYLRRDHRLRTFCYSGRNSLFTTRTGIKSLVWFTYWHPANTGSSSINRLTLPLFKRFGRTRFRGFDRLVRDASLIIVESSYGLFLAERLRRAAPKARLVYRQSDDLDALGAHPALLWAEAQALEHFDLISVPDSRRLSRFRSGMPIAVQNHGIEKDRFDEPGPSPYRSLPFSTNAVFVGIDGLDRRSIATAAERLPTWGFHLIGPWESDWKTGNVIAHGEMPFNETVPFVAHADVGLHTITRPGAEMFRESLKIVQYTYCRLPIVAEERAAAGWPHVFPYSAASPDSILDACLAASAFPRESIDREGVRSWRALALQLADGASAG